VDEESRQTGDKRGVVVDSVRGGRERTRRERRAASESVAGSTVDRLGGRELGETRRDLDDARDLPRDLAGSRELDGSLRSLRGIDDEDFGRRRSAARDVDYDYIFGNDDTDELVSIIIGVVVVVVVT